MQITTTSRAEYLRAGDKVLTGETVVRVIGYVAHNSRQCEVILKTSRGTVSRFWNKATTIAVTRSAGRRDIEVMAATAKATLEGEQLEIALGAYREAWKAAA